MKKVKLLFLMLLFVNSFVFAESQKVKYDYYVMPNALLAVDEEIYVYWFNIIAAKGYFVSEELREGIINSGGTRFTKGYRQARILEVSKVKKNLVRIEYQIDYDDEFSDMFWTHKGSLILIKEYNKRFL